MKNKIISLLLLATMLLSVLLTSCSEIDTGYEEETSTIPDITLTLYGIKEEGTTDEAIALVESEINRYTQDKYKTTVELHLFSKDEYAQTIEDAFVQIDEQTARNELAEKAATAAAKAAREAAKSLPLEEQKEKKRAQRAYEKWAEERGDVETEIDVEMSDDIQLDLFMVDNYEYYSELVERELITDISSAVTGTYSLITKFVNPTILSVAKVNNMYYGVPTNRPMGFGKAGYYYAFKTDLVEKYGYQMSEVPALNLSTIDAWLESIVAGGEDVVPFFAPPAVIQNFDYYMDNMADYPAYGTKNLEAAGTTSANIQPILYGNNTLNAMDVPVAYFHFRKMYRFRQANYFAPEGSDPATTDFAVGVFHGTLDEVKAMLGDKADQYTYATYAYPRVVTEDLFGSTFVVSSSCKYPTRAVQLICGFCTDEKLRNLITFGVENVHYEVNDDGETVTKLTNDYNIGFESFGNSLIGYVPEELGATYQADSIEKNKTIKSSAFVGYTHILEEQKDVEAFEVINGIIKEYIGELMNGYDTTNTADVNENGVVDIDDVFEEITTRLGKDDDALGLYGVEPDDDEFEEPYIKLMGALDSNFSMFAGSRPGGTVVIDNNIITKEEKERREALLEAENPETEEVLAEGEVLPEGEAPVEGEILPEGEAPASEEAPVVEETPAEAPVEE